MFFFFSSRRRHTRSLRDWSSDVCSSDLAAPPIIPDPAAQRLAMLVHAGAIDIAAGRTAIDDRRAPETGPFLRSEERRVGKECRSRWWTSHEKKKEESKRSKALVHGMTEV